MALPTNRAQFRELCLRRLGKGVIEINVDPDQVEDRIDEALDYWQQFHHDATMRVYMKHQLTQTDIDNGYIPMNQDVIGVTRVFKAGGSSGSGNINMFDLRYQIHLNDFISFRSTQMLDYYLIRTYLEQIDMMFVGEPGMSFNRHTDRVYIHWDWKTDAVVGQYIILETLIPLNGDEFPKMWQDRMLQKYATALIKLQWANNAKKFGSLQLLGGVTIDGPGMFAEATTEIAELEESIREEFECPPHFITG